jgi:predicted AlkP superfamily phosphohydrolase/phosphomutase
MDGGICINEWLLEKGYLHLKQNPEPGKISRFEDLEVDWSRTIAWGNGGYYGRVFFNVKGREPQGIIPEAEYEEVRRRLAAELTAVPDPHGRDIGTKVYFPEEIYREVNGIAPDLIVYFGDLFWRSVGSLGHGDIYTFENDTGPDDCNHAQNGIFILHDPRNPGRGEQVKGAQLMDVCPTILEALEVKAPTDLQGRSLKSRHRICEGPTPLEVNTDIRSYEGEVGARR